MNRMGSSCSSMQRQQYYESVRNRRKERRSQSLDGMNNHQRSSLRHSVICAIPDKSIANLYPVEDNYVNVDGTSKRSPKSLTELCIDSLCRSLPNLNGELPPGLPQDVVDDVIDSLLQHSALNATTLRVLKNCEFNTLNLAGCRGVTDEWLQPLSCSSVSSSFSTPELSPKQSPMDRFESMDLDEIHQTDNNTNNKPRDIFYNTFDNNKVQNHHHHHNDNESSSCSSSASFVSANSNHYVSANTANDDDDHPMNGIEEEAPPATPTSVSTIADVVVPTTLLLQDNNSNDNMNEEMKQQYRSFTFPTTPTAHTTICSSSVTSNIKVLDLRGSQGLTDHGLMQLTNLHRLQIAKLDNCHGLTGRGLLAFVQSHQLHTLSLANCRRLTDEAIINISHLLSLQAISLDGCRCITDRSLEAMSDLYCLRKLDLSQCDLITDDGITYLENLHELQELSLGWCRQITDHGLNILSRQPNRIHNLHILRLSRCTSITDIGIVNLSRLESLYELDLNGCSNITSTVLGNTIGNLKQLSVLDISYCPGIIRSNNWQGKINNIKTLELCYSSVKDSHITKFMNLYNLQELNLDSCPIGDTAIAHLADHNVVPNLISLDLADTNLTDVGMIKIAKFTKLIHLSLFYCNISNGGLRHLSKLTNLEVLNLDSRDISDDGLAHLKNLQLKSLDIFSGRITDNGCAHIAKIKTLESLELCGGGIGDLGCTLLASLDNLISLNLSQNERITNRGAAALATLLNLRALNLSNTRVNSTALKFFSGLLKLQSLALYGCRVGNNNNNNNSDNDHHNNNNNTVLGNLQNDLPNLKCLRLNTPTDCEDGMIIASGGSNSDDIDDDDDDNDDETGIWSTAVGREFVDDLSMYSNHD